MTVFLGDGLKVFLFVESGMVRDQGGMGTWLFTQQVAQPRIDERRIGGAGEPQGGEKIRAAPRGHPVFARAPMARAVAVNLVAPGLQPWWRWGTGSKPDSSMYTPSAEPRSASLWRNVRKYTICFSGSRSLYLKVFFCG